MIFPNTLIRASAGTGKTFQLSNRYIGLAASGEPVDGILATTFTRKAAGEILDRVLGRLADASLDKKKAQELARHTEQDGLECRKATALLRDMVLQLHRLRTGTLDSFFIQIAQSFALELGLPPGWQIVDEVYDAELRAEAVREVLQNEATGDVVRLMNLLTKGEAARSVSEQILTLVTELHELYAEAPAEAWDRLPRHKPLSEAEVAAAVAAVEALPLPNNRFITARDGDVDSAKTEQWGVFLSKGLPSKILDGSMAYYRVAIPDEVAEAYRPLCKHAKAVLVGRIANQTEATRRLLERFDAAYQRLKLERRAMRFGDVARKLGEAAVAQRLDDVVYRIDGRVSHLLLDEFQDTSPLQWRVLRPFAERVAGGLSQFSGRDEASNSRGQRRPENGTVPLGEPSRLEACSTTRSFFCVGDVKQAIYGWRGGVAEIFEALCEELPGLEPRALNQSFRSSPVVIETVNRVFENLCSNAALRDYSSAADAWCKRFERHTTALGKLPGYCRMIAAPRAEEGEKQGDKTLDYAAQEIARLYEQSPGHTIGVLARRNVAVARLIYRLRKLGIEASEEGGNPLTDSPAVQFILSLLRLADHPGDTTARFHVANCPLAEQVGLTDHTDADAAWRLAADIRARLVGEGYGPTVYGWAKQLAAACDGRDLSRLLQLVEMAYSYDATASTRPGDFLKLVEQRRVEDPTSACVRVMSIHQAKGLQFDVVVLPELDGRLAGQNPEVVVGRPKPTAPAECICRYVNKDLRELLPAEVSRIFDDHQRHVVEESLCVLYVAMTRAVHALHLIVSPAAKNEKTISKTFAGVVRSALAEDAKAEPGTVLFEQGDAEWFRKVPPPEAPAPAMTAAVKPAPVQLAASPKQPSRGLDRRSPSQLEGGGRVRLSSQLRLDTGALDRGSLIHAWFMLVEWLDGGEPDDAALRAAADAPGFRKLDVPGLMAFFRASIRKPAIRAALCRDTYCHPAAEKGSCAIYAQPGLELPQWKVWRERPFAIRDGDCLLNGSIDRLVVLYGGEKPIAADVLDFKTDVLPAGNGGALASRVQTYRPQLDAYRRAVAAMFRLDPACISARLAFLEPGVIETV